MVVYNAENEIRIVKVLKRCTATIACPALYLSPETFKLRKYFVLFNRKIVIANLAKATDKNSSLESCVKQMMLKDYVDRL